MARITKTEQKRAYLAIKQKAQKVFTRSPQGSGLILQMDVKDYTAIERIVNKYLKRF
jgi:hypothetical protein